MKDYQRLLKNILGLSLIVGLFFSVYLIFFSGESETLKIDETPIHIESIKTIAEIATVSYKDEIVVDSVQYYKGETDYLDPYKWPELYDRAFNREVKKRLTLIIKGEVRYGLDLTSKNYRVSQNQDTMWVNLPKPTILDVVISPKATEVFEEKGRWSDGARRALEEKAKLRLKKNAAHLKLDEKAIENTEKLMRKLIQTDKKIIFNFE